MHFRIVFLCHSGNVRVRNQIVISTGNCNILLEKAQMISTGIQRNYMAQSQPSRHVIHTSLTGQRRIQYLLIGYYPNEPRGHSPRESENFSPVQECLPPHPSGRMLWGSTVVSVNNRFTSGTIMFLGHAPGPVKSALCPRRPRSASFASGLPFLVRIRCGTERP